ncbi:hypothetical protein FGIG_12480 [Fasciola gigantica]|uniref:Uncharacterized protein n=1 Tax=Fasciola gigantica TaxID=46835 RepID=A0A504Z1C3_FASGI|nr:hypothetical protein FGIG_12480 [Fasciola gigantica]
MELAKDQQCLKDDLEVEVTDSRGGNKTYPVLNGEYAEIEGDVQCSPCNVVVKVRSDSIWKSINPKKNKQWFGKSEFIPIICDHL